MNKKRILSIFMAFCLVVSMVLGTQTTVLAKSKTIKIVFNGKSITMGIYREPGKEPKTLSAVEKKLGKKTRLAKDGEEWAGYAYVWEKGKTKIIIMEDVGGSGLGYACAEIKDNNGSIAGIKVGMTKAKTLKKMKNIFGSKNVTVKTKYISADLMNVDLKNGKVSGISWMRS